MMNLFNKIRGNKVYNLVYQTFTFSYKPRLYVFKMNSFAIYDGPNYDRTKMDNKKGIGVFSNEKFRNNISTAHLKKQEKQDDIGKIDMDEKLDLDLDDILDSRNAINSDSPDTVKVVDIKFDEYIRQADKMFDKCIESFQELETQDKNVKVELNKNDKYQFTIKIHVKDIGVYVLTKELETKSVSLLSPVSGFFRYKYEPSVSFWRSEKDSHILNELLMREFCKHSKGLLIIN